MTAPLDLAPIRARLASLAYEPYLDSKTGEPKTKPNPGATQPSECTCAVCGSTWGYRTWYHKKDCAANAAYFARSSAWMNFLGTARPDIQALVAEVERLHVELARTEK